MKSVVDFKEEVTRILVLQMKLLVEEIREQSQQEESLRKQGMAEDD